MVLFAMIIRPVRRHVWRWTSERERDKPVFDATLGTGLSGFRDNETGDARAYVQSLHLRLLQTLSLLGLKPNIKF